MTAQVRVICQLGLPRWSCVRAHEAFEQARVDNSATRQTVTPPDFDVVVFAKLAMGHAGTSTKTGN